jgi:hypothetical protein
MSCPARGTARGQGCQLLGRPRTATHQQCWRAAFRAASTAHDARLAFLGGTAPRRRTSKQGKMRTRRRVRRHVSRVLSPVAAAAAVFYFLIDAVFLSAVRTIIRPLARALSRLRIFNALAAWLVSLGPYPTQSKRSPAASVSCRNVACQPIQSMDRGRDGKDLSCRRSTLNHSRSWRATGKLPARNRTDVLRRAPLTPHLVESVRPRPRWLGIGRARSIIFRRHLKARGGTHAAIAKKSSTQAASSLHPR